MKKIIPDYLLDTFFTALLISFSEFFRFSLHNEVLKL